MLLSGYLEAQLLRGDECRRGCCGERKDKTSTGAERPRFGRDLRNRLRSNLRRNLLHPSSGSGPGTGQTGKNRINLFAGLALLKTAVALRHSPSAADSRSFVQRLGTRIARFVVGDFSAGDIQAGRADAA